uniref:NADPH oxidase activator 1 n=1 Tax=Zonotrichia albicollis TaxID=44394 RepID=A0A8D2MX03_ZONAL
MPHCGVRVPFPVRVLLRARCLLPPPRGGAERAEWPLSPVQPLPGRCGAGAAPRGSVPVPVAAARPWRTGSWCGAGTRPCGRRTAGTGTLPWTRSAASRSLRPGSASTWAACSCWPGGPRRPCGYEEALSDYHLAFSHLRENPFIDYKQLGLRHILYAWEVLYSTAAVQCHLQQWQEARVTLEKAVVWRPERRTAILELALERVQDHLCLEPMLVPLEELFRPRKKEVEQLDSKDFLGKPKVISSIIPNDEYIGFEPLRPQKQGFYEPSANALREAESGYHRVLARYRPEEPPGQEVAAGSLVFVLGRAADGWATAIHDGQKLHIPSSLLEPASRMDKWKISTGIPLPPAQVPPSRLPMKQKPDPPGEENASVNDASAHMDSKVPPRRGDAPAGADRPAVLRLRCECSLVLRAGEAPALPALRALLRDRLAQQAQRGALSYRLLDGTELGTVLGQEDLGKVWQQLMEGKLILCCQDSDSHSGRPVLYQMLAQHSYLPQGPGDLEFSKGDVLDILSEVNEDWLEGRCNGKTGIFPKCFATQTSCDVAFL